VGNTAGGKRGEEKEWGTSHIVSEGGGWRIRHSESLGTELSYCFSRIGWDGGGKSFLQMGLRVAECSPKRSPNHSTQQRTKEGRQGGEVG